MLNDFCLLISYQKGKTINSEAYIETLKKLRARIRRARPQLEMKKIFFSMTTSDPTQASKQGKQSLLLGVQPYRILHILVI